MRCDDVQADLSAAADGEDVVVDREHVQTCAACSAFERGLFELRSALRFDSIVDAPDVAPRVIAALAPRRSRRLALLPAAAALVAGAVAGSVFVWPTGGNDVAGASIPARIVAAQHEVASVAANVRVVEHSPDLERTGTLRYRAPEQLELRLGADVLTVAPGSWRSERDGVVTSAVGVEPFSAGSPAPLDLVLPVGSFAGASEVAVLGDRTIDGREALGVRVTVAQLAPLLDGLALRREVHATDEADLWLDAEHLVPVEVAVRAADGIDRRRWAAARGHDDRPGDVLVEVRVSDVVVNDASTVKDLGAPTTEGALDRGFMLGSGDAAPLPRWLPPGMEPGRAGVVGVVAVRTWTDGRAWVKVRSAPSGSRLVRDVGPAVRTVDLAEGIGYVAEGGEIVAIAGDVVDVVVTGSISPSDLRRVAASLGVAGRVVPAFGTATSEQRLPGFAPPAVRVDGDVTTAVFAGPGDRAVVLSWWPGRALTPPLDADAVGVAVRGTNGRWSPLRGELEWVEAGRLWSLRSTTVGLAELVQLAAAVGS